MRHPYQGKVARLTTKHGKAESIATAFERIGVAIETIELDTDALGTFTAEIPRLLPQRECAIQKARMGMAATGSKYGLASEASIGSDPLIPFLNSTVEAIAWIDDENGIELVEFHRSLEVVAIREEIRVGDEIGPILERADFPNHAVIVHGVESEIFKGIREREFLDMALAKSFARSKSGIAVIESDLRAHMSPSRRMAITACAEGLVSRLARLCPSCNLPGFGEIERTVGLPCEICGNEVIKATRSIISGCAVCDCREELELEFKLARAQSCDYCNP